MLRTLIISRNELVKSAVKRNVRNQVVRGLSSECVRRRHQQRILSQNKLEARPLIWNQYTIRGYADYPPHTPVNLPALSPTMETGTIISWAKKEGDKLNEGDLLAEIETDKATMGFETPEEGYLAKILVPAGSKDVPIGKLVCIITENKDDVASFNDYKDTGVAPAPPKSKAPSPPPEAPPAAAAPPPAAPAVAAPAPVPIPAPQEGGRVYASPMAKRLAEIRNVRLQGKGSGIFGSIKAADVGAGGAPAAAAAGVQAAAVQGPATARYSDTPISNIRAVIAKRLTESKVTIPHYYLSKEVNVEKLLAFREQINKQMEKQKMKVSINDFVIKAVAAASARVPEMNSAWLGNVIRQYHGVDVSVAVSTDRGLITPIVFDADRKGVIQISKDMKVLAAKARENKLTPAEFQGGTITVSNLGMFDVPVFAAIINPPQAGILAVGSLAKRVISAGDGQFREAPFITVTLSADHRVADGAVGAQWLKVLGDNLSDPGNMCL